MTRLLIGVYPCVFVRGSERLGGRVSERERARVCGALGGGRQGGRERVCLFHLGAHACHALLWRALL